MWAWLFACVAPATDSPEPAGCPEDLPSACPADAPTYADVEPIVAARCVPCHASGTHDFRTYPPLADQATTVLSEVYNCQMPPEEGTPLTDAERATLLDWLVCGAPE